ncbi:MAG: Gfo/Idh/MocA family oxidoreductase, partial [Clostridia bacterium]|nr:Gfo/Idh/MocA family oxidoreductase [Clostridia bacterium]
MQMMRVAIIGQGRSGRDIHGKFFGSQANDFCRVVCIVDEDAFRAQRAAQEFCCDVVSDYTQLF